MDGQQNNALQAFEEAWFDIADHVGKEFQLPNLSSPIYPIDNMVFLQDPQHHSPNIVDNSYKSETIDLSFTGNEVCLCPIMEMVSSITSYGPVVDRPQFTPTGGSIPVTSEEIGSNFIASSSFLLNGSCVQWSHVVDGPISTNKSGTGANGGSHHGPEPLQNVSYGTQIGLNGSVSVENYVGALDIDPHSSYCSSEENKAFGPTSSNTSCSGAKYRCNLCYGEFLNYSSNGGHMCSHAGAEIFERDLTSQKCLTHNSFWSSNVCGVLPP
ncbi:hypothetical protein M0R45_016351 [Rubus argutus]|uniref:C2H2-type domain-containing protein n=1 Tax=Rubus argutus TaxID=59490 RepID=A0AAW1XVZ0_RUBAR